MRACLDRGLASARFSQNFPTCHVCTASVNHSDHLSLSIPLFQSINSCTCQKSKPKRFEPHWMKKEECLTFFDKLWLPDPNPSKDSVRTNFESILEHLLEWSKKKFGHFPLHIKKVRQQLDNFRSQISWSSVEEAKLELELEKQLSLEKD